MDKKEFLSALERSLSVLQEDELRDIVSEYEQHIDIKVAKGLTEEEAIADFGSFSELTAELLEAYHVRADYAGKEQRDGTSLGGIKGSGEIQKAVPWAVVKHVALGIREGARWTVRQVIRPFVWFGGTCRIYWERLKRKSMAGAYEDTEDRQEKGGQTDGNVEMAGNTGKDEMRPADSEGSGNDNLPDEKIQPGNETGSAYGDRFRRRSWPGVRNGKQRQVHRRKGKGDMIVQSVGRGAIRIGRWAADMAGLVLRTAWNCCWLLFSLMTAGFGLFCLYGLGVLVVLLTQGYPLTGVTLGCMGLVMCTFSASVIGFTFLRRRGTSENRKYKSSGNNRDKNNPESTDRDTKGRLTEEDRAEADSDGGFAPEGFGQRSEDQIRRYHERGGEITWVNCGV